MALVRWNPIGTLAGMEIDRLNRMFADFHTEAFNQALGPGGRHLRDRRHEVVIKAELPDVKREDIGVTFENNVLTLTGERKQEQSVEREQFQRIERRFGSFSRSFTLPASVDAGADRRVLQGRRADDPAAAPRRGEAEADLGQRRIDRAAIVRVRAVHRRAERSPLPLARAPQLRSRWRRSAVSATLAQHAAESDLRTRDAAGDDDAQSAIRSPAASSSSMSPPSAPSSCAAARLPRSTGTRPAHAAQARTRRDGRGPDRPDPLHAADPSRSCCGKSVAPSPALPGTSQASGRVISR